MNKMHQRHFNGACQVGCCRDQTASGQRSAGGQTDVQAQRRRGVGNHAEVRRVETVLAEVVKLSKPVPQEQR